MLIARKEELAPLFDDTGLSRIEILPGASSHLKAYKCALKAGKTWEPPLFSFGDKVQFFVFLNPTGYISTSWEAWTISDTCNFIPNFDADEFTIHAGRKDLDFYHFVGEMHPVFDIEMMNFSHIVLPRFRLFKDGWQYTEGFTGGIGSTCQSHIVIEHEDFGRYSMGWNCGDGPSIIGEHVHSDMDQWYFILPGGVMTYTADGQSVHVSDGDVTYTKMNTPHGSVIGKNERINYFWVETAINGYNSYAAEIKAQQALKEK